MSELDREIAELVALQLGAHEVAAGDRLIEELRAESADLLNLVATLEERYGIRIEEEEIQRLATVADVQQLVRSRMEERSGGS